MANLIWWPDEFAALAEDEGWNIFGAKRATGPSGPEIESDDEYGWFRGDDDARRHVRRMCFWTDHEMYRLALKLDANTWGLPQEDMEDHPRERLK